MKNDTNSYKGWLNSDYFLKRILAVLWYSVLGTIFIYVATGASILVVLLIALAAGVVFGG